MLTNYLINLIILLCECVWDECMEYEGYSLHSDGYYDESCWMRMLPFANQMINRVRIAQWAVERNRTKPYDDADDGGGGGGGGGNVAESIKFSTKLDNLFFFSIFLFYFPYCFFPCIPLTVSALPATHHHPVAPTKAVPNSNPKAEPSRSNPQKPNRFILTRILRPSTCICMLLFISSCWMDYYVNIL